MPTNIDRRRFVAAVFAFALLAGPASVNSQTPPVADSAQLPAQPSASNPDAGIVAPPDTPRTPEQLKDQAWSMLTAAAADEKHTDTHIQALSALGLMGGNPRSLALIRSSMNDKDVDVRIAAVLAAGQTGSPNITTDLRRMLDDKEPAATFAAALTLWKMHDRSGEDILTAVADGDRKTAAGLMDSTSHSIHKQLRDPTGLAKYGAMQGAYMLLGPFGMGLTAIEYIRKNGGDSARVSAIEAIAQNHTVPIRKELIAATADKDLGVRAAACKALSRYHEPDVAPAIAKVFDDSKSPVRLTAAAAYLISAGAVIGSPVEGEHTVSHKP